MQTDGIALFYVGPEMRRVGIGHSPFTQSFEVGEIVGFRCGLLEFFRLLGYYAA
jgi:hypothetical protein